MIYDMIIIEIRMNSRELQKFQKIQKKKIKKNTSLLPLKRRSCFALAEKDELRESRAKAQRWAILSLLLGSSSIVCSGLSLLFFSFIFPLHSCISSIYVIVNASRCPPRPTWGCKLEAQRCVKHYKFQGAVNMCSPLQCQHEKTQKCWFFLGASPTFELKIVTRTLRQSQIVAVARARARLLNWC